MCALSQLHHIGNCVAQFLCISILLMINSPRYFSLPLAAALVSAFLAPSFAWSQAAKIAPAIVIEGDGVSITTMDLDVELAKAPPEVRAGFMQHPERLAQLASNLMMRRALAKQAQTAGLAKAPFNQAALQLASDRVLSDIQLSELDKTNRPSDMVLEQRARDVYRAESKRFEIPEQVKASHILILASEENAEAKASELLAELKAGKDFEALAKARSQDPGSGAKGGDLGFFGRGRMAREFEEAAFQLKTGELSGVVKSQFGFHIIKVTERIEAGKKPYDEVRDTLLQEVSQKILTEARIKAGQQIMQRAKTHPEVLDAYVGNQQVGK